MLLKSVFINTFVVYASGSLFILKSTPFLEGAIIFAPSALSESNFFCNFHANVNNHKSLQKKN